MAGVSIASHKVDDIYQDQKRLRSVMKGEISAFGPQTPNKDNITPTGKAFSQPAKTAQEHALAAYDMASVRDAYLCVAGRKYMRRKAVASKLVTDLRRLTALKQIELEQAE